ncbi:MAG: hypothetical protein QM640_11665 [Niabella sp.]
MMQRSSKDIEKILDSFNGMRRAEARPFMHTRVLARLREENTFWGRTVSFIARPVIAVVCLASVLIANIYTVIKSENTDTADISSVMASSSVSDILHNDNYVLAVNDQ